MTCKYNEAVALNRTSVEQLVAENGVVAIRADKTHDSPEIDQLLKELGNEGAVIPYLAIFPGAGGDPITFDGPITQGKVLDALRKAGPSGSPPPGVETVNTSTVLAR